MVAKIGTAKPEYELDPHPTGVILPYIHQHYVDRANTPGDRLGPRPTEGTRLRASYSLDCARQIGFQVLGLPRDEDLPGEVIMNFEIGHKFHDEIEEVVVKYFKDAQREVTGVFPPESEMSSHADFSYEQPLFNPNVPEEDWPTYTVVGEIKSISGYGFMIAVGERKSSDGELPGPKIGDICQVAMSAIAPNIDGRKIHLIYADKDKSRIAEWIMGMDTPYEKLDGLTPRELAHAELERMHGILARLDSGMLPMRHIPGVGRVEVVPDPDSRNQPWNCRYCGWNSICKGLPASKITFEDANLVEMLNAIAQDAADETSRTPVG